MKTQTIPCEIFVADINGNIRHKQSCFPVQPGHYWAIGWYSRLGPVFMLVRSWPPYTDMDREEAIGLATESLQICGEGGWFYPDKPREPDYVIEPTHLAVKAVQRVGCPTVVGGGDDG